MIVTFRPLDTPSTDSHEQKYITPGQVFLSLGKQYEVHALSVYDGVCFLLVLDDMSTPDFKPRALFDVVDSTIPDDWVCNTIPSGPVQLLVGPEFIARDVASYNGMIDQRSAQSTAFWDRVRSRTKRSSIDE